MQGAGVRSIKLRSEFFPGWLHHNRAIRENDGGNAVMAVIDVYHKLCGALVAFYVNFREWDTIGLEEGFGAAAVTAYARGVNYDLRRGEVV